MKQIKVLIKKSVLIILGVACMCYLTACGKAVNSSSTSAIANLTSSISGQVLVPSNTTGASSSGISTTASGDVGFPGATVKAYDGITNKQISEIPTANTDSEGKYTLDLSKVTDDTQLTNIMVKASKTTGGKTVVLSGYLPEKTDKNQIVNLDQGSTAVANSVKQSIYDSVGDMIGQATAGLDATTKANLQTKLKVVFELLYKFIDTLAEKKPQLEFDASEDGEALSEEDIELKQMYTNKAKVKTFIEEKGGEDKSKFDTARTSIASTTKEKVKTMTFPENLKLPKVPKGFVEGNEIELPPIDLPKGCEFNRGLKIPEYVKNNLPQDIKMNDGFDLPNDMRLPKGTHFKKGFNIPTTYTYKDEMPEDAHFTSGFTIPDDVKIATGSYLDDGFVLPETYKHKTELPKNLRVSKNAILAKGTKLPSGIKFENGYEIKKDRNFSYDEDIKLPANVAWETGYEIPDRPQDTGFKFESHMNMNNVTKYSAGIDFADDMTITQTMADKFDYAGGFKVVEKFLDKMENGTISQEMITTYLDPNTKIKETHLNKVNASVKITDDLLNNMKEGEKLPTDFVDKVDDTLKLNDTYMSRMPAGHNIPTKMLAEDREDATFKKDNDFMDRLGDQKVPEYLQKAGKTEDGFIMKDDYADNVDVIDEDMMKNPDANFNYDSHSGKMGKKAREEANKHKEGAGMQLPSAGSRTEGDIQFTYSEDWVVNNSPNTGISFLIVNHNTYEKFQVATTISGDLLSETYGVIKNVLNQPTEVNIIENTMTVGGNEIKTIQGSINAIPYKYYMFVYKYKTYTLIAIKPSAGAESIISNLQFN